MSESTLWWIIAGLCVSLELLSNSGYLLMLAFGPAAAAVAAVLGASPSGQVLWAACAGGAAVIGWHQRLLRRGPIHTEGYTTTGLSELDVGEEVRVAKWAPDGTAQVHYRGAEWLARHHGPHLPKSGLHRIRAVEAIYLVLEPV